MSFSLRTLTISSAKALGFFTWAASCAWLFREYGYDWTSSHGPSMYPTLSSSTKYNIISKRHRLGRHLRVGDLITLKHPNLHASAGKRVIGLPGDFVIRDAHLSPTVGGMPTPTLTPSARREREQGQGQGKGKERRPEPDMIEVPPGHVWVAGDNLSWSRDSRFYGAVPMGLVQGKIIRYSNPESDWLVDMVKTGEDQLRPVRMGGGVGDGDDEEWTLAVRSSLGMGRRMEIDKVEVGTAGRS